MSNQFKYLFSSFKIGSVEIRNRICFTAHATNLSGERLSSYMEERARGGAGLIVLSSAARVDFGAKGVTLVAQVYNPDNMSFEQQVKANRLTADAVHKHGTKIFGQINHGLGRQHFSFWNRPELIAGPSAVPCPFSRFVPHELDKDEIKAIVVAGGKAALAVKESGFDGLELNSTNSGYLLAQFLSPFSNKRADEYGGSLDNRMRFFFECLDEVRRAVGSGFPIGIRLMCDEMIPGGYSSQQGEEMVRKIAATANVNYVSVDAGGYPSMQLVTPDMSFPPGVIVYLAAQMKEAAGSVPVLASHRINDPLLAEKILADGQADIIGMCRSLICDPELPNKAREGRSEEIRHCVACNEGCVRRMVYGLNVTCVQNPLAGRELEVGTGSVERAKTKKKVMVVGGGPGGLKAAETAAKRGHYVFVYEKEKELGGQVSLQAREASRQEYGEIIRHLSHMVGKLGVIVKVGVEVTPEMVKKERPDVVVLATGSTPIRTGYTNLAPDQPGMPGADQDNVFTDLDVLKGEVTGERVIVVDDTEGDYKVPVIADFLADQGKKVEIMTPLNQLVRVQAYQNIAPLYQRLLGKGVTITCHSGVKEICGNTVVACNIFTQEESRIEGVDSVVLVLGHTPNDQLYRDLKDDGMRELYRVGDCNAPRSVMDAIREGWEVGMKL